MEGTNYDINNILKRFNLLEKMNKIEECVSTPLDF